MKGKRFIGPTKRMKDALEAEGLRIDWPERIESDGDLAITATFYTGPDREKLACIDLRGHRHGSDSLKTKGQVNAAVAAELQDAYEAFDIDEAMWFHLQGDKEERKRRRVPETARLLEDMQEQAGRLKRFAEVAEAVAAGRPVPPEPEEEDAADDGESIRMTPGMAKEICDLLWIAYPAMNNLAKGDASGVIRRLYRKMGEECRLPFGGVCLAEVGAGKSSKGKGRRKEPESAGMPHIVIWAQYNRNESKGALCCGRLRRTFASVEEAKREIMARLIDDAKEWAEENGSDEGPEAIARRWIWHEGAACVNAEHDLIEDIYSIERI